MKHALPLQTPVKNEWDEKKHDYNYKCFGRSTGRQILFFVVYKINDGSGMSQMRAESWITGTAIIWWWGSSQQGAAYFVLQWYLGNLLLLMLIYLQYTQTACYVYRHGPVKIIQIFFLKSSFRHIMSTVQIPFNELLEKQSDRTQLSLAILHRVIHNCPSPTSCIQTISWLKQFY